MHVTSTLLDIRTISAANQLGDLEQLTLPL